MAEIAAAQILSLQIYNRTFATKSYYIFQDAPKPENGPNGKVFSNVYDCSGEIPHGEKSEVTWRIEKTFYAIYGSSVQSRGHTVVSTSNSEVATLGPGGSHFGLAISDSGSASFDGLNRPAIGAKGGFGFTTGKFKYPNEKNVYIGIGAQSPTDSDKIIPLQTYIAEPQLKSILYPKTTYFIATGKYEAGMLVDRAAIGRALRVDFTGAAITTVSLYQNNEGDFYHVGLNRLITEAVWEQPGGVKISIADVQDP